MEGNLTAYPSMLWRVHRLSFASFLAVELWLSFISASYNGAMVVFLVEIMPAAVKRFGFSLAGSLAVALFGGFTPALCTASVGSWELSPDGRTTWMP
jgi:MFS transporter, MHS family, citrate/tricarballylate:H+ symporter